MNITDKKCSTVEKKSQQGKLLFPEKVGCRAPFAKPAIHSFGNVVIQKEKHKKQGQRPGKGQKRRSCPTGHGEEKNGDEENQQMVVYHSDSGSTQGIASE